MHLSALAPPGIGQWAEYPGFAGIERGVYGGGDQHRIFAAVAAAGLQMYLDLAQLLLQIDSATVGTLDEQAVHDTLSDVWLRAEEQFILRVPKTSDISHAAVLQGTMAQLTQLARNRSCEL
ncbi:hypothetical protein HaLaN_04922 [Haematococcus lacustris]|uniref:Uncharacterized protein n=1 Tax=Haematococcus lacustris TaxID=44745 RepID=A0A699YHR8_HAELA|nr:hypothetical protein HaLaN_04922 [Haematococcus lacustris]